MYLFYLCVLQNVELCVSAEIDSTPFATLSFSSQDFVLVKIVFRFILHLHFNPNPVTNVGPGPCLASDPGSE